MKETLFCGDLNNQDHDCASTFFSSTWRMGSVVALALERLSKSFHTPDGAALRAVDGLSLSVSSGERMVLLGPSGSGKTTTLRLIAGLEPPDAGTIQIQGQVVNDVPAQQRNVGMVFQNDALYPHMTALENIAFGLKVRGRPRAECENRAREMAEMLRVSECLKRQPAELSGGQRQRIALARALVRRPSVLLLDEPFSNIDPPTRQHLRSELSRLQVATGSTVLLVTHDQAEAMALSDRIALMKDGKLLQAGPPLDLYHQPADMFVAGFLGSPPMNFFRGELVEKNGALFFQEPESTTGPAVSVLLRAPRVASARGAIVLGLRPEHIQIDNVAPEKARSFCAVSTQYLGSEVLVTLGSASGPFIVRVSPEAAVRPGDVVPLQFSGERACFFEPDTGRRVW